jgi:uncharacterized membrane protein YedE/YeeE
LAPDTLAIFWGLGIGAVIGAAALLSNFCALGGVADILFAKDWRRMRAWMLAAGVALLGTQALDSARIVHIDRILVPYILWLPTLLGGACFGFGMALAGGCINRALVRVGVGSLKSLVIVLTVTVVAALTAMGPLKPIKDGLARAGSLDIMVAPAALHRMFGVVPSWDSEIVRWVFAAVIGGGLVIFSLKDSWFRAARDQVIAGILIGLAIPAAWLATDNTGTPSSINFAAPFASMFSLAVMIGVPVGAFIAGLLTRNLALETFSDRSEVPRNLIGAALMGFGGTIAVGCTFGQGLSGLSTLSVSAFITIAGIVFGCLWGIRYFEAEGIWAGLKLVFRRGA